MIHEESEFSHVVFLQEEPFLAQLEFAPQPDATHQPYFDGVVQRQPGLAGQLGERHLALLEPSIDEVWEFRTEKPGIRVFGRFAEYNIFVALNTELRENIDADFAREKEECKRLWRHFFQSYKPLHGTAISDYIDNFTQV